MFSAKVNSSQELYGKLNQFLAHAVPYSICLTSRTDYRDPSMLKITLDYGRYQITMPEHDVRLLVEHRSGDGDVEAHVILLADSFEMNMKLVNLALSAVVRSPDERVVPVFAWDSGWHQKQAVWVKDHTPSKTQQRLLDDVTWFYSAGAWHEGRGLPYQRGLLVSGPSASGKHWSVRHLALTFAKALAYLPVTEHTFGVIGPALACAPLNSIIIMDNLGPFFQAIPTHERGMFLRHLETAFNTSAHDPRGLLIVALLPGQIAPELERFLRMPHRFQDKFDLSISGVDALASLLAEKLGLGAEDAQVTELSEECGKAGVPVNVLNWFFASRQTEAAIQAKASKESEEKPEEATDMEAVVAALRQLVAKTKEERGSIDAPLGRSERLYS